MSLYYPYRPRTRPPARGVPSVVDEILTVAPELRKKLGFGYASDRASLAADRRCPPEVLALLARDTPTVVVRAAANPHCPPEALAGIIDRLQAVPAQPAHWLVQHTYDYALRNPNCPEDTLRRLFADAPATVPRNPSCPVDLISAASRSRSWTIRLLAVGNRSLRAADLLALVTDDHPSVAWSARYEAMHRTAGTVRSALLAVSARNRRWMVAHLTPQQIRRLARDPDPRLRRLAARVTRQQDLLSTLAGDSDGHVRRQASERLIRLLAA